MLRKIAFLLLLATSATAQDQGRFLVTRNYRLRLFPEKVTFAVNLDDLRKHGSIPESGDFDIVDENFGKRLTKRIVGDQAVIDYVFESDKAIYSFSTKANGKPLTIQSSSATHDPRLAITYLSRNTDVASWPDKIIGSVMALDPEPKAYDNGFAYFLTAVFARWSETRNPAYLTYIKTWADRFIDSHGSLDAKFYHIADYSLDDLLPGRIFISLFEETKDSRYRGAAQHLRQQLQYQPRTSDGGFWHKQSNAYQMWLDGVYPSALFLMQYAKAFNEPGLFNEAMQQINLMHEHNGDPETGLLYQGWDESGISVWSNEDTGTSREFWSRGIAWYYTTLLDGIDYIPLESLDRKHLGMMFRELTKSVQKFEDPKTALWYQVINKSYEPRNWIETSASAMFAYGFAKGFNKGILDKSYRATAQKAFASLQRNYIFFDDQQRLYFDGTVRVGTLDAKVSKGDLDYYVSAERQVNDYKGLGALLYLSMELD